MARIGTKVSTYNIEGESVNPCNKIFIDEKPNNHGNTWSGEDLDLIRQNTSYSLMNVARKLERTPRAVYIKACEILTNKTKDDARHLYDSFGKSDLTQSLYKLINKSIFSESFVDNRDKECKIKDCKLTIDGKDVLLGNNPEVSLVDNQEGVSSDVDILENMNQTKKYLVNEWGKNNNVNFKTGESNMTQRKTVIVELFDDSKGLKDQDALVWYEAITTAENDESRIIQQVLLDFGEAIREDISDHNELRMSILNEDILERTGHEVMLREIEFKDLRFNIKQ